VGTLFAKYLALKVFHGSATTLKVSCVIDGRFHGLKNWHCKIVYPDHLGNNQRLFDKYGPIFKSTNMGKTVLQTNDPELGQIALSETEFFSKEINDDHPLKPIKQEKAGVFVSDTSNPA
jgi:hypothetical protein